jgi:hypothetical protein
MDGFGIVIVDNLHPEKYTKFDPKGEDCFNYAKMLSLGSSLIGAVTMILFY